MLTLSRIILIPFFVLVFYPSFTWASFVYVLILCIVAVTDWFDGLPARRWNQSMRFGAFLNPIAGKVLVTIVMVLVTEYYCSWWVTLPTAIIIACGIIISTLREWMVELGKRGGVTVSWIGKVKTTSQMVALAWLLRRPSIRVEYAGIAFFLVTAILTLWSMFQYLGAARGDLSNQ